MLFVICLFTFNTIGNASSYVVEESFVELISTGNSIRLKHFFNSRLQVSIGNNGKIVSAQQAYMMLDDFFSNNPPQKFRMTLNGGKDENRYLSGILVTSNGIFNLSIYYTLIGENKKEIIQQIRIKKYEGQLRLSESAD